MSAESLLLVDDDRLVHEALERELAGRVERVLHAFEPEDGLRIALQERPDIILLDVNLPRMDGLKLCRHLKEAPSTRDVPILFLTVDSNVHRLARALEIGATDYIRKPFDPVELRARVAAALRLRRMINLLRDQAWIDPLTGVKNRAAFDDALAAAAAAFERVGQPAGVLLLDLDHFKAVNDRYGHGVGDEILRRVGAAIRSCCRPYDTACRFGGDEFAVVYTQAEGMDARRAVVRVLDAIREISVMTDEGPVRTRCSAGLACTKGSSEPFAPGDLVKAADEALYEAKRAGRDRLVVRTRER
jgi:diguanylate cyclase (GGDEF)-like protein